MAQEHPALDGVHRVKLPANDSGRSRSWHGSRLGHVQAMEFRAGENLTGLLMLPP